jgi:hypothetical protein
MEAMVFYPSKPHARNFLSVCPPKAGVRSLTRQVRDKGATALAANWTALRASLLGTVCK